MHVAVICKPTSYERISVAINGLNPSIKISSALTSWNSALDYVQKQKIDGLVIEESLPFFIQVSSLPLPSLVYSGTRDFRNAAKDWIQSLGLEIESTSRQTYHSQDAGNDDESKSEDSLQNIPTDKTGAKVAIVAKNTSLIELIESFGGIQVVAKSNKFNDVMDLEKLNNPEVIFLEEGVMPKDEPTLRDLKILQVVSNFQSSENTRLAMMLFERKNNKLYQRLVSKGYYHFLARNNVSSADIERLVKVPNTLQDVTEYQDSPQAMDPVGNQVNISQNEVVTKVEEKVEVSPDTDPENTVHPSEPSFLSSRPSVNPPKIEVAIKPAEIPNMDVEVKTPTVTHASPAEGVEEPSRPSEEQKPLEVDETPKGTKGTILKNPIFQIFRRSKDTTKQDGDVHVSTTHAKGYSPFSYPMPHRIIFYSPKGGAGATSMILSLSEGAEEKALGVAEISYSYGQIAGKLGLHPSHTIADTPDGLEELALCKNKYLCAPWIYSSKKPFNDTLLREWLVRAERAFVGKTILADLQSQSSPLLLMASHEWCTKSIWVVQNSDDHLGMADIQMSHLKRMGDEWKKIGLIIQGGGEGKIPWEDALGVPVIGKLGSSISNKDWKRQLQDHVAEHLGLRSIV